jgi:hypothetical protein
VKKQKKVGCTGFVVCNTRQTASLPSLRAITLGKEAISRNLGMWFTECMNHNTRQSSRFVVCRTCGTYGKGGLFCRVSCPSHVGTWHTAKYFFRFFLPRYMFCRVLRQTHDKLCHVRHMARLRSHLSVLYQLVFFCQGSPAAHDKGCRVL